MRNEWVKWRRDPNADESLAPRGVLGVRILLCCHFLSIGQGAITIRKKRLISGIGSSRFQAGKEFISALSHQPHVK